MRLYISEAQVKEPERVVRMYQEILRRVAAIPGVSSAAFASFVPADGNDSTDLFYAEDRAYAEAQLPPLRRFKFIAPGFFQTMGTRLIAGRDLTWTDLYDQRPVTLVSENLARELWRSPEVFEDGSSNRNLPDGEIAMPAKSPVAEPAVTDTRTAFSLNCSALTPAA